MDIVLPIHKTHVDNIFNGSKKYEYRKIKPTKPISKILIYETSPIKSIVGEVEVLDILEDTKNNIWQLTCSFSGIPKEYFLEYFKNTEIAIAYKLGKVIKYETPKDLKEFGINYPPQSLVYVNH